MSSNNPVSTTWGTTKGMLKKLQLREISRDKKLSVFLWFVAALIVIGIYWYFRHSNHVISSAFRIGIGTSLPNPRFISLKKWKLRIS